ncbi:uncharacterized protein [Dysidea avara]|uniref:uncharacterized protein n=1 Tax=Dysidea avara TaxID=196820 RepID=UPI003322159E
MDTVIKNFTEKLTKALPLDDAVFRSKLDDAGLFYGDLKEEVKAKPTAAQKAEHFLDHGIKSDADNIRRLLKVMEEFNNSSVKSLAREIKVDIDKCCKEPGILSF